MTLKDLLYKILGSKAEDWNDISCWGAFSGPSYKDKFSFYNVYDGQPNILHADSYSNVAIYKQDISISIAYGLTENNDFVAEWANKFADSHASSSFIDVFYNNGLVYRNTYVVVDGGRCKLPIPSYSEKGDLIVDNAYHTLIKLLHNISSGSGSQTFDSYFAQTGISIVEEEWL